jgi:hypothetical protein
MARPQASALGRISTAALQAGTAPADYPTDMRQLAHIVAGVLCWLLLAFLWVVLVLENKATPAAFRDTLFLLAVLMGTVLAITIWWVRHNVGIHRRKGPRQGRPEVAPAVDQDRLGRRIRWAMPGGVRTALTQEHLIVELDDDVKTYRGAS